jgi:protocatechuate 3,4-dioxygenase beta subunit
MIQDASLPHHAANWASFEHDHQDNILDLVPSSDDDEEPLRGDVFKNIDMDSYLKEGIDAFLGPPGTASSREDLCAQLGLDPRGLGPANPWQSATPTFDTVLGQAFDQAMTQKQEYRQMEDEYGDEGPKSVRRVLRLPHARIYARRAVHATMKLLLCATREEGTGVGDPITSVSVSVADDTGQPLAGRTVYAYKADNGNLAGQPAQTGSDGRATLDLPPGRYFFGTVDSDTFFKSDLCQVPGCQTASIVIPHAVVVTVKDTSDIPLPGQPVYAFANGEWIDQVGTTGADGRTVLTPGSGTFVFVAWRDGIRFESEACTVPLCTTATVVLTNPVTVTVVDPAGTGLPDRTVFAYSNQTSTGIQATTGPDGKATLTVPEGQFVFGTWEDERWFTSEACAVPDCVAATIATAMTVTVSVVDTSGTPQADQLVYPYLAGEWTGWEGRTNSAGQTTFWLFAGTYTFATSQGGLRFESPECSVPTCSQAAIVVTKAVTVSVVDCAGKALAGRTVYVYEADGTTWTGAEAVTGANGRAQFTLWLGSYVFGTPHNGTRLDSGVCELPACQAVSIAVPNPTETLSTYAWVHTVTSGNRDRSRTRIDSGGHSSIDGRPGARIFVTQLLELNDPVVNHSSVYVSYNTSNRSWYIGNENGRSMPVGAKFVVRPEAGACNTKSSQNYLLHVVTDANLWNDATKLAAKTAPVSEDTLLFFTHNLSAPESSSSPFPHNLGTRWWDQPEPRWEIFTQDEAHMVPGLAFNVKSIAEPGPMAFVHTATAEGKTTAIDHPATNNNADAKLIVTPTGDYFDAPVGIQWTGGRWRIRTLDLTRFIPAGAKFNVWVVKPPR